MIVAFACTLNPPLHNAAERLPQMAISSTRAVTVEGLFHLPLELDKSLRAGTKA